MNDAQEIIAGTEPAPGSPPKSPAEQLAQIAAELGQLMLKVPPLLLALPHRKSGQTVLHYLGQLQSALEKMVSEQRRAARSTSRPLPPES